LEYEQLLDEVEEQRDIIIGTIDEAYSNITYQTLQILQTFSADPQVSHILKTDDDSFIRVDRIKRALQNKVCDEKEIYMGFMDFAHNVIRDVQSPW
jgi:hypothetical protein